MPLVYVVVDDAKHGIYHTETNLENHPYVKICQEERTWNFVSQRIGRNEICLYKDAKPFGSFSEWTARLPSGLVVGVFDSECDEHVENYALFTDKVKSFKERQGVERRHSIEIHPL